MFDKIRDIQKEIKTLHSQLDDIKDSKDEEKYFKLNDIQKRLIWIENDVVANLFDSQEDNNINEAINRLQGIIKTLKFLIEAEKTLKENMKTTQLKEALKSEIRKVLKEEMTPKKGQKYDVITYIAPHPPGKLVDPSYLEPVKGTKNGEEGEYWALDLEYLGKDEDGNFLFGDKGINDFETFIEPSELGTHIRNSKNNINEMARIAKTLKISDLDKAKAVIDKVKDTKKKWIADMIQKVIDAGDEGIAQVALAKALGKVDEFGDGRQQAINPEVRSLLGGDVFTFGAAKMEDKPEVTNITTDDEDEIITSVPDEAEDEEEINITNDDVEDSEDEDETEADKFLKSDEEETEDDEEVAKKATPNKRIGSKADQLDAVITDMKKLAADYKKAKTDGDKDKEKEIADKLKEKTKLKKDLEKDIQISLGDETDEDEL